MPLLFILYGWKNDNDLIDSTKEYLISIDMVKDKPGFIHE